MIGNEIDEWAECPNCHVMVFKHDVNCFICGTPLERGQAAVTMMQVPG